MNELKLRGRADLSSVGGDSTAPADDLTPELCLGDVAVPMVTVPFNMTYTIFLVYTVS